MSSCTAMTDAMDVFFASSMPRLVKAGSMRLSTCGSTTRRSTCTRRMPRARAPSHWPAGSEAMPPRKISEQ